MVCYVNLFLWQNCVQCFKTFLGDDIETTSDGEEIPQVQEGINISLIELIGKSQAKANVALFKQWMPIYLDELETAYEDYLANSDMQQTVSDVAHKIKGAAASVGLVNVQNIAKQVQRYLITKLDIRYCFMDKATQ